MFHPDAGDYEFSEAHNARIRKLATAMMVFGAVSIGWAGLLVRRAYHLWNTFRDMSANPLYANSQNLDDVNVAVWQAFLGAVIPILFGLLSFSAALSFRKIVSTQGSDIPNLMEALKSLSRIYIIGIVFATTLLILILINVIANRYLL